MFGKQGTIYNSYSIITIVWESSNNLWLKKINPSFTIPQCYCNLEKQKDIFEYLQSRTLLEIEFWNDHSKVFERNLGVLCIEMEETKEYIKKDNIFRKNPKYQKIKCSSLKERKH